MKKTKIKRISATIDAIMLSNLDKYVELLQTVDENASRSSVLTNLIRRYIPTTS